MLCLRDALVSALSYRPRARTPPKLAFAHVRFTGHASAHDGAADDQRDRHMAGQLAKYYDEVIFHVRAAESILLFGPGEAKGELQKRLASTGLGKAVVGVETTDRMTDREIVAKVRQHYAK